MMKLFEPGSAPPKRANPLEKHPGDLPGAKAPAQEGFEAFLKKARRAEEVARRPDGVDVEGIGRAAQQFESFFLASLFKTMRQTVPKDGLFEQGFSSEVYTEMLDQEYARSLSEGGGIGLADVLERQFLGNQGHDPPP